MYGAEPAVERLQSLLERILGAAATERYFPQVPPDREAIPATAFRDPELLIATIRRAVGGDAAYAEAIDLRPAASRFIRQYAAALLPAVLAMLSDGLPIDAAPEHCTVLVRNHLPGGVSLRDDRGHLPLLNERTSQDRSALRAAVLDRLFTVHLRPLIDGILRLVKVSPELLWSNVAEHADLFYEAAVPALAEDALLAARFKEDWDVLVGADELPGVLGPNPIKGFMSREPINEPGLPPALPLRTICCIHYELPDRVGRLCSDCPLATTEERILQARHMRGMPLRASAHVPRTAAGNIALERSAYLKVGDPAPEFTLPSTESGSISLADYRGRQPVVVFFYVKDGSPACSAEVACFRDHLHLYRDKDVAVLGIGPDSVESHLSFRDKLELQYPLLSDDGSRVAQQYGAWQVTHLKSHERAAITATTFVVGVDGTIKAVFADIRGGVHAQQVLAALSALDLG